MLQHAYRWGNWVTAKHSLVLGCFFRNTHVAYVSTSCLWNWGCVGGHVLSPCCPCTWREARALPAWLGASRQRTAKHLQVPFWRCCGSPHPMGSGCVLLTTAGCWSPFCVHAGKPAVFSPGTHTFHVGTFLWLGVRAGGNGRKDAWGFIQGTLCIKDMNALPSSKETVAAQVQCGDEQHSTEFSNVYRPKPIDLRIDFYMTCLKSRTHNILKWQMCYSVFILFTWLGKWPILLFIATICWSNSFQRNQPRHRLFKCFFFFFHLFCSGFNYYCLWEFNSKLSDQWVGQMFLSFLQWLLERAKWQYKIFHLSACLHVFQKNKPTKTEPLNRWALSQSGGMIDLKPSHNTLSRSTEDTN